MNTLYYGDNLDILRQHIADESIDLIYLDPPFNSNATYNVLFGEQDGSQSAAQIKAFEDTWKWDEAAGATFEATVEAGGKVAQALLAFRQLLGDSNMLAYLTMMAPRLVELRRVLKPTGSIYLHCDPTASHYLKVLMDAVFGAAGYRNEICWRRTPFSGSSKARARQFPRSHDVLLLYTRSEDYVFQCSLLPYGEDYYKRFRNPDNDPRGPYQSVLLKTYSQETLDRMRADGRIIEPKRQGVGIRYKQFLTDLKGRQVDDVWTDINMINPVAKERLGYPTQKPTSLLERIIQASSNEGDVVMDPFCGCGTTVTAAQKLNRTWIGIDITHLAITLIKHRLQDEYGPEIAKTYQTIGEPVDLAGAQSLAAEDPYQFQWWALGLVGARPVEQKKGADRGIDGRIYFHDEMEGGKTRRTKQVILSVKAGHVNRAHMHELRGVVEREQADIGVLITMQEPTQPMRAEAASAGIYSSPWGKHPRLQILTIADLLAGKRIDMPPLRQVSTTFRRAPKARRDESGSQAQMEL